MECTSTHGSNTDHAHELQALMNFIDFDTIGHNAILSSPFGQRTICYADFTASGRAMHCIENFIRDNVLALYGNTHTASSATGLHSTLARSEARAIVLDAVGGVRDDAALFVGSGSTAAIAKLVRILTSSTEWQSCIKTRKPPLVLTGPYEHHSNILPWRESGAHVIEVKESSNGGVDMKDLEALLLANAKCKLKIGTFSAASNITGILSDTVAIATMLHRHGALAFFDYAAAGPYLPIDMNPDLEGAEGGLAHKDAIFLSPHKLVGGVATPGVLVIKRAIAHRFGGGRPPTQPGGGTVLFVLDGDHEYLDSLEEREEGGTPDIVGAVRCALAFRLKATVGPHRIVALEAAHWARLRDLLAPHPAVRILGNSACPRLAIVSFIVSYGDLYLHHNFVAALLNDLFGIQARAGCACAGPYGYRLLKVDSDFAKAIKISLRQGDALVKPGFVRIGAAYFMSDATVGFLAAAIGFIAEHGWRLLPLYTVRPGSSEWRARASGAQARPGSASVNVLGNLPFGVQQIPTPAMEPSTSDRGAGTISPHQSLADPSRGLLVNGSDHGESCETSEKTVRAAYLSAALAIAEEAALTAAEDQGLASRLAAEETGWLSSPEGRNLRWFALPSEAAARLRSGGARVQAPERSVSKLTPFNWDGGFGPGSPEDHPVDEDALKTRGRRVGCIVGARAWLCGRR